ncbi:MAG: hypothetical protein RBR67_12340 [Desulfobacterium sp.]|jgi:hypothetical protein|nr:hypothetical protein [Desulfobacterium sp.]
MDNMKISELMRPIDDFPHISSENSFMEGVTALENVDKEFKLGNTPERILLVHDVKGKIIGKLSPMDIVLGLEPKDDEIDHLKSNQYYHMIRTSLQSMNEPLRLWQRPLGELCQKADSIKIHNFIKMPTHEQMVMIDDNLDIAFHLFVVQRHGSLFVKDGQNIVGLILFSDVYKKIREIMKNCPVPA